MDKKELLMKRLEEIKQLDLNANQKFTLNVLAVVEHSNISYEEMKKKFLG